jgi:hypothetical protein
VRAVDGAGRVRKEGVVVAKEPPRPVDVVALGRRDVPRLAEVAESAHQWRRWRIGHRLRIGVVDRAARPPDLPARRGDLAQVALRRAFRSPDVGPHVAADLERHDAQRVGRERVGDRP